VDLQQRIRTLQAFSMCLDVADNIARSVTCSNANSQRWQGLGEQGGLAKVNTMLGLNITMTDITACPPLVSVPPKWACMKQDGPLQLQSVCALQPSLLLQMSNIHTSKPFMVYTNILETGLLAMLS
jgi:hypothetical protein